jgi:hypothetical protein
MMVHVELAEAIRRRLEIISDRDWYGRDPQGHLAALKAASERVLALADSLPAGSDPMLRHYLERQSYVKALDWLNERAIGDPSCKH